MIDTYESILKVGYQMQQALANAMVLCQSWGYNGLKRYYRWKHNHFNRLCLCLKNEMFDDHEIVAQLEHGTYPAYKPMDIKEHAKRWCDTLKDATTTVAGLNVILVGQIGMQSCIVKDLLECLYKMKEKACRFYRRGVEVNWMPHDLHVYDDLLHDKVKHKEEKE